MTTATWTSSDVLTVLAWLDFCVQNNKPFRESIVKRLKEAREPNTSEFNIKQVTNKLIGLGRKDGESRASKQYSGLREIISKGSVSIPGLGRELRLEIAEAVEQLRLSHAPDLTSRPALPLGEQNLPKEKSSTQSNCHDGKARQIPDIHGTPSASPSMTQVGATQASADSSAIGVQTIGANEHTRFEVATNLTTPSHLQKTIDIRRPQRDGRPWHHHQTFGAENDESGQQESIWEAEVVTLYGKVADLEKKNQKLGATLQLYDNARHKAESAGQDPQEAQFRTYHQKLWNLEQRNMKLESSAGFFKLGPYQKRALQEKNIDDTIDKIQSQLRSILDACDTTNLQLNKAIEPGSDSEALLLSSLDLHQTPQDLEPRLEDCISQFEVPVVVRTLVLAALQDWVFNTSFPPFTIEGAASLFLKSMEEVILDNSDWAWLRNLETAAYSRFLERREFKTGILSLRSRLLADRLMKVITTLLLPAPVEGIGHSNGPRALDHMLDLDSLHFEVIDLFSAGLEFKAAAGGSDYRYEFLIRPLRFEQTLDAASNSTSEKIGTSRPWRYASLRVYDAGPADWLTPQSDAIIQINNFVSGMSRTKSDFIYSRDINNETSERNLVNSTLQTHSPSDRAFRPNPGLFPSTTQTNQPNSPCNGSRTLDAVNQPLRRRMGKSNQPANVESTADQAERSRTESSLAKQLSPPEDQLDEDDDSLSTIDSVGNPFEVETNLMRAEPETTIPKTPAIEYCVDVASKQEARSICSACGTKLSSYDSVMRHQRKKSCRRCIICEKMFPTSSALKVHQETEHLGSNKRRRLSQDDHSAKRVNLETAEPKKNICEKCGYGFQRITSLQRHTLYKSCLHCYKCSEKFDRASDCSKHLISVHGLQFIKGRWRRIDSGQRVEEQLHSLSKSGPSPTASQDDPSSHERSRPETRTLPPSTTIYTQADMNLGNTQNEGNMQNSSSQVSMENGNYCATCNEWFSNLFDLERHQARKRHRDRARKLEKQSALQIQRFTPKPAKKNIADGTMQDGVSKRRVEKRPRSRASTEMRREPTPESRHVARSIAELQKANENTAAATTISLAIEQNESVVTTSVSQRKNTPPLVDPITMGTEGN